MSNELQLRNRQKTRAIDAKLLKTVTRALLADELALKAYQLGIHLVEPEEMAQVNWDYLQHEGSTDVITFDYRSEVPPGEGIPELYGELYICVNDALKQAKEFKQHWTEELARYVVHGVLHLRGYDDLEPAKRKVMKKEENRLVKVLAEKFALKKLAKK
ncbi:MAG: putative metal-dependent hydrolase [Verrucomicrobia bacterium]|jgi:probable rRNA maturation factor|nr:putative metal-dependent hydrolase [Verrucomicrobiota bacterium]